MLLSIVMMVKDEEKNLKRTLLSLESIRNKIDCELIILDTGSKDNTMIIANEFTDKVFNSDWNNDFAAMRNKSIGYAKGDWILILDADEELVDDRELINFFYNENYKSYKSAYILLRNLSKVDNLNEYSTALLLRLFENDGNFKYEGSIHEQPLYKEPIYESPVGEFNHYGYIYEDEELKQNKLSRNEKLLLAQLSQNPNDPYINYQLGKNYLSSGKLEYACRYLEKSLKLYEKIKIYPDYIYENLAKAYLMKNDYQLCERICNRYIKEIQHSNIDIFYFLAKAEKILGKLEKSKKSYEKYLFYLDNYSLSTQSKSVYSEGSTVNLRNKAIIDIIKIYYELKDFKNVILNCDKYLKDNNDKSEIYVIIVNTLYKMNNLSDIKKYYDMICKTQNDTNDFIIPLENLMQGIDKENRKILREQLIDVKGNYGTLNKIRLGYEKDINVYRQILIDEKANYYGDIVFQCIKDSHDIYHMLKDLSVNNIQKYMDYIVSYKREIILDLYKYFTEQTNTLNINKIKIHKCIARSLVLYGGLFNEKFEKTFYLYQMYTYIYLRMIYNVAFTEEQLIDLISDLDDRFVLRIKLIEKSKENHNINYIKLLKELLIEYPQHGKGIKVLTALFEEKIKESSELKNLKLKYKTIIETNINNGKYLEASKMIDDYDSMFSKDVDILNMKFIINLMNDKKEDLEFLLKDALMLDPQNYNTIFNIAYLKEVQGDFNEALMFYEKIISECKEEEIIYYAKDKINSIKQNLKCIQGSMG